MKKFIISSLIFIPLCIVIYTLLLVFFTDVFPLNLKKVNYRLGAYGHMNSRIKDLKNFKNIDILFLGASNSYRSFDNRIYSREGLNTFNLGSTSQTPIQSYILLERYLDSLNPATVIYTVPEFENDGVESSIDLISNDRKDFYNLLMMAELKNMRTFNTTLYGFYRSIFNKDVDYKEPLQKDNDTYISGGFVEKKLVFYSSKSDSSIANQNIEIKQFSYQKKYFEKIIQKLKARKINLFIVNTPVTQSFYVNDKSIEQYIINKAKYFNFNSILNLNDTVYFYNKNHMNQNGVNKFNKKVIEILKLKNKIND